MDRLYKFGHAIYAPVMLRYLGFGDRRFGVVPMYIHKRTNWEFFAVLQGRCAPMVSDQDAPPLQTRHLWVFPPGTSHGWTGAAHTHCRVAVFHFSSVPHPLERIARRNGRFSVALSPAQTRLISRLATELKPHYEHMTEKSLLVFERALLDLSLLMLNRVPSERTETKSDFALRKVEAALTWYQEHMAHQPKLEEVALAVNVSVRHLRRLFQEVRSESPQTAFTHLRIQRAMELLSQTEYKMEIIARECGFSSNSDFSRVFKQVRNVNPDAWRRGFSTRRTTSPK